MSRAAQRKNNIIAIGRQDALKGYSKAVNPYLKPEGRGLWLEGWEKGHVEYNKRKRENRRKRRLNPEETVLVSVWKLWYGFKDLFSGRFTSTAQTPARKRGRVW